MSERPAVAGQRRGNPFSRWIADLRTAFKISGIVAVLAAAALAVGVISVVSLADVYRAGAQVDTGTLVPVTHLAKVRDLAMQSRVAVRDAALASDPAAVRQAEAKMRAADTALDAALTAYRSEAAAPDAAGRFQDLWTQYRQARDAAQLPAAEANDDATFVSVATTLTGPLAAKAMAALDDAERAEQAGADKEVATAKRAYTDARTLVLLILAVGLALGLALAAYVTRLVLRPLHQVSGVLTAVAAGDLTQSAGVTSRDEIGRMAVALDDANARTRAVVGGFTELARTLATSVGQLSQTNEQMAAAASQASDQASLVSTAADQVSSNVQTVAASSEEMGASIGEIARNAAEAAQVAATAVQSAESATATVSKLGESSEQVGNVIKVITSIAEQTNLLALNATIEAARAGDAGKGFAVVASEVKDLAQETAKATDDIAARIETIQADITSAVSAIADIAEVITRIDQFQTTIAAAVEEQTATSQEIGRSIGEAASGARGIADNTVGMANAARTTTDGVVQTSTATAELTRLSTELQQLTQQFRV